MDKRYAYQTLLSFYDYDILGPILRSKGPIASCFAAIRDSLRYLWLWIIIIIIIIIIITIMIRAITIIITIIIIIIIIIHLTM